MRARARCFRNGKPVELTTFEFDILEMLMRSAGRVLSRDALMEKFYNRKATPFDRSHRYAHQPSAQEAGATATPLIKTIRGVGYQFCALARGGRGRMRIACSPRSCCGSGAPLAITVVGSAFISALSMNPDDPSERRRGRG